MQEYQIYVGENGIDVQATKDILLQENNMGNINIVGDIWQSKYNENVRYDFPPFCLSGFKHYIIINCEETYIEFLINYLIKIAENIEYLSRCLLKEMVV